ncbi:MAG: hypothetical protein QG606_373 [Patescibacteria group bacterium]|jgi:hypothetical protein|nr:hypothetical protein [Patescibacteria group bacterium]
MQTVQEFKLGDPRRVIASAESTTNQPPSELIWGSKDPVESLRMARIIVNGGWLAITLNEEGAKSFTYLNDASAGVRVVYYIDHFSMGTITAAPILLGQFLFEFEACPAAALPMSGGGTNRVYFRMNGQQDKRVAAYDFLTGAEVENTKQRLLTLAESQVGHRATIDKLLEHLNR